MSSKPVRRFTAILLGLILAQVTAPQAFGATLRHDATDASRISASAPATPNAKAHKAAKPLGVVDARAYRLAAKARLEAIRAINETFTATVREARNVYRDARAAAKTPAAKADAAARYADAVTAATEERQRALDALPPLPTLAPTAPRPTASSTPTPTASP